MLEQYMDIKTDVKKSLRKWGTSSSTRIYNYSPWNALSPKCKNSFRSRENN